MKSNQRRAAHRAFVIASERAIADCFGAEWRRTNANARLGTVYFEQETSKSTRILQMILHPQEHFVEIILAVKRSPSDPAPQVWWEDRSLHAKQSGYLKQLWSGERRYAHEVTFRVPRDFWIEGFPESIARQLREIRDEAMAWFSEAETYITSEDL